jgi:hypothetical protein
MTELVMSVIAGRYGFTDLFVLPNILMRDRPEVFTLSSKKEVFLVDSGTGGIMGHAHELVQLFDVPMKVKDARVYFTVAKEYLHSHPDDAAVYYIAKVNGVYQIFDLATRTAVTQMQWGAGHRHGLSIREVIYLHKK